MKFYFNVCLFSSLLFFCVPADPNFRTKPLRNTEYTGFISRNFFQAVVEVPLTKDELSILDERKACFQEAIRKRDGVVIPILKKVAMEDKWNEMEREKELSKASDKEKEKRNELESKEASSNSSKLALEGPSIFDKKETITNISKNPFLNRGEFAWFLDGMFLYKEDYSDPEKCSFVFRNIQDDLFAQVEKTKLSVVGEDSQKKNLRKKAAPTNPNSPTNSTSPLNTGIPQIGR